MLFGGVLFESISFLSASACLNQTQQKKPLKIYFRGLGITKVKKIFKK
jgi:hypothetical protein